MKIVRSEHGVKLVKNRIAKQLIDTGAAVEFDNRSIKMLPVPKSPLHCGQSQSYEALAIEKHPVVFLGGLNRTENRPAIIPAFKGARVGH